MKKTGYIIGCAILSSCIVNKLHTEDIVFKTEYKFSAEIERQVKQDTLPWKYQISAADYATKGDYKNALIHWDMAFTPGEKTYSPTQTDSITKKYTATNALDFIAAEATKHQVVIINEAHHNSYHRFFTRTLLKKLYDKGYRNLGLEALGNGTYTDSVLNQRKFPVLASGHYIKDPQFGNLVREALEMGYHVFAYEATSDANGKLREIEQARNIQKEMKARHGEKFLIHCGFDHALEGIHSSWEKAMAGRLAEYTGTDPLTIDQVLYSEKSKPGFRHPLSKALNVKTPSILTDSTGKPLAYKRGESWADLAIFHPVTDYTCNRPNWLFNTDFKKTEISLQTIRLSFPLMVLAFKKGEDRTIAIPTDITEVNASDQKCLLALKKGEYEIVVTNGKNSVKFEYNVK